MLYLEFSSDSMQAAWNIWVYLCMYVLLYVCVYVSNYENTKQVFPGM